MYESYPELKENFIDKGHVKLEYRNFPLDLAAFNAAKVAHCKNSNGEEILHFLYTNQSDWVKGNSIEEIFINLCKEYTELKQNLFDENGNFRSFINIYLNDNDIRYADGMHSIVKDGDSIQIVPSIAGGCSTEKK